MGLDLIPLGCGPGSDPPQFSPLGVGLDLIPLNFPLGCGPGGGSPWQGGLPGRGVSLARGGLPGRGVSLAGGSPWRGGSPWQGGLPGRGGLPACTEAGPPPVDRQTPVKT